MKLKKIISIIFSLPILFVLYYSCTKDKGKLPLTNKTKCDSLNVKFSADINPLIQAKCINQTCHTSGGTGGDFTTHAGISTKADVPAGNGSLRKRIIDGQAPPMPPSGALPLPEQEKIDCWLKAGAPNN